MVPLILGNPYIILIRGLGSNMEPEREALGVLLKRLICVVPC